MAYPRRCEGCGIPYTTWAGTINFPHLTLAARDGGTASPWAPDQPGRLMDIGCRLCGAIFRWDYFAVADGEKRLGKVVGVLRGPINGWQVNNSFASGPRTWRSGQQHRRAS